MEEIQARAYAISKRLFGDEYPGTMSILSDLSWTITQLGRLDEALMMQEQALLLRNKIVVETHPDTLRSMELLALIHRRAGSLDEAKELQVQVMECRRQSFGDEHPHTHRIIEALADTYRKLGDSYQSQAQGLDALWRSLIFPNALVGDEVEIISLDALVPENSV